MDIIKLNFNVILKHILDMEPKPLSCDQESLLKQASEQQDQTQEPETAGSTTTTERFSANKLNPFKARGDRTSWILFSSKSSKMGVGKSKLDSDPIRSKTSRLDLSGPSLGAGLGMKSLLCFFGLYNWSSVPFYLTILYKCIFHLCTFNHFFGIAKKFWSLNLIDESFRNPIFLFIGFLGIIATSIQVLYNTYLTTFCLYPIQKILTIPKLCFVRKDVLEMIGSRTVRSLIFVSIYQTVLVSMLLKQNFNEFTEDFDILNFILDFVTVTNLNLCIVGVGLIDFYVRTSFGHWLLALKDHLEKQFKHLHSQTKNSDTTTATSHTNALPNNPASGVMPSDGIRIITLDEIQKSLNNMDDQLEIMRSVHSFSLVVTSLNAFLTNGALILLTYHLLSDEHKNYHGFIMLLISLNYGAGVFNCYFGDSWLYYGLSSLVETIEDEYFLQRDIKETKISTPTSQSDTLATSTTIPISDSNLNLLNPSNETRDNDDEIELFGPLESSSTHSNGDSGASNQLAPILRKKHVLFFGEFLHQFENHLATPWTNLTFESHLHIVRAFVTLIAAQIIFDHEH